MRTGRAGAGDIEETPGEVTILSSFASLLPVLLLKNTFSRLKMQVKISAAAPFCGTFLRCAPGIRR